MDIISIKNVICREKKLIKSQPKGDENFFSGIFNSTFEMRFKKSNIIFYKYILYFLISYPHQYNLTLKIYF